MKALCWHGKNDVRYDTVPDPAIEHPRDAIINVSSCAICGSDLHLYDHYMPGMSCGDVLGHEFMGEVMEVGSETKNLKVGDRVVVPFTIFVANASSVSAVTTRFANAPIVTSLWQIKSLAMAVLDYLATLNSLAAMQAAKPSLCGCPSPIPPTLKCPIRSPMSRCCF